MTHDPDLLEARYQELLDKGDRRALAELDAYIAEQVRWKPQPYQVPPDDPWWTWVFCGGAGSGKTDTGAWWLDRHMTGPPCDTRLPGGHKALIAGPTFSDAVATCWGHPAGISAHNAEVEKVGRQDGTYAIWPNGAEALFAGLHTEHDADLLRARAANCCLAAGTLVATERGRVPIEHVRAGDRVWTRSGLRRVLWAGQVGEQPTRELETVEGRSLRLTGDHEVWADDAWVAAVRLHPMAKLTAWSEPFFTTTADDGAADPTATTSPGMSSSTATSTSARSARSRRGISSTTATATRRTTRRRTSWRSRRRSTSPSTPAAASGTPPEATPAELASFVSASARDAAAPTPGRAAGAPIAAVNATGRLVGHERNGCALCAALGSPVSDATRPAPARDAVRRCSPSGRVEPVYDLTVEHDHEFFANGILVANCTWWIDEAAIARHLKLAMDMITLRGRGGPRPHGIVTSTPKPSVGWRYLVGLPGVVTTRGSSYDNRFLSAAHKRVIERFRGTRLEAQEIYGELLDDFEGALWRRENIDADRILDFPEDINERLRFLGIQRVMVGIDPSTWDPDLGDDPGTVGEGIETGIIVVGIDNQAPPHLYVLDDLSRRGAAEEWAGAACEAFWVWEAAALVPETNAGGGLVLATIRLVDPNVAIYREGNRVGVRAAVGKRARAEPISLLSEQHRWHHVGTFPALESQLCQWDPRENWSPDRLDGAVWAATALNPAAAGPTRSTADILAAAGSLG